MSINKKLGAWRKRGEEKISLMDTSSPSSLSSTVNGSDFLKCFLKWNRCCDFPFRIEWIFWKENYFSSSTLTVYRWWWMCGKQVNRSRIKRTSRYNVEKGTFALRSLHSSFLSISALSTQTASRITYDLCGPIRRFDRSYRFTLQIGKWSLIVLVLGVFPSFL